MKTIHVSYGPPSRQGVESIMGIGADELDSHSSKVDNALKLAGLASVGAWVLGVIVNSKTLRTAGLGGAAVAFAVRHVSNGKMP